MGIRDKTGKQQRRILRSRMHALDRIRCAACGATAQLSVHHIKPRPIGGSNRVKSLIALCQGCHDTLVASLRWNVRSI